MTTETAPGGKSPGQIAYEAWCEAYYGALGSGHNPATWKRQTSQARSAWEAAAQMGSGQVVAAERERIAGMADRLAATVPTGDGPMPFSAVIRHVPQDGDDPFEP
jgi:hypothetical protein